MKTAFVILILIAGFALGGILTWQNTKQSELPPSVFYSRYDEKLAHCLNEKDAVCVRELVDDRSYKAAGMTDDSFEKFLTDELFENNTGGAVAIDLGASGTSAPVYGDTALNAVKLSLPYGEYKSLSSEWVRRGDKIVLADFMTPLIHQSITIKYSDRSKYPRHPSRLYEMAKTDGPRLEKLYGMKGWTSRTPDGFTLITWSEIRSTYEASLKLPAPGPTDPGP